MKTKTKMQSVKINGEYIKGDIKTTAAFSNNVDAILNEKDCIEDVKSNKCVIQDHQICFIYQNTIMAKKFT